jgi:hypothetical protein
MASTTLSLADNFDSLDARSTTASNHLFYMTPPNFNFNSPTPTIVQLVVHSVDNKAFYSQDKYTKFFIVNPATQTRANMLAGRIQMIMSDDTLFTSNIYLFDAVDTDHYTVTPLPSWDLMSAIGTPIIAKPGMGQGVSMTYLKFYDDRRGGLAWAQPNTKLDPLSEFSYIVPNVADPIHGLISAYTSPTIGKLAIMDTDFNLVVEQTDPNGQTHNATFPLERETSNIIESTMNEFFNIVLLGTPANPTPAIYFDSTLLRGSLVSVIQWDNTQHQLVKTLQYSLTVPSNCLNMSPVKLSTAPNSFTVPFLCNEGGKATLRLVTPGQ